VPCDDGPYKFTDKRNKWLSESPPQVSNVLSCLTEPCTDSVQHLPHRLSAVQHRSCFLIADDVVLDFTLQLLVDLFELDYLYHYAVDLRIEQSVFG